MFVCVHSVRYLKQIITASAVASRYGVFILEATVAPLLLFLLCKTGISPHFD